MSNLLDLADPRGTLEIHKPHREEFLPAIAASRKPIGHTPNGHWHEAMIRKL